MEELDERIENLLSSNEIKGNHCKLQEELGIKTCLIEADDDFTYKVHKTLQQTPVYDTIFLGNGEEHKVQSLKKQLLNSAIEEFHISNWSFVAVDVLLGITFDIPYSDNVSDCIAEDGWFDGKGEWIFIYIYTWDINYVLCW